jgi:hypothetical protein
MNLKIALTSFAALVGSSKATPFVVPLSSKNVALSLRGGAGPLDVETTAKVFTGITTVQGALDYLSAKTVNKLYNIDLSDDISSFLQKYVGGNQAAVAIMLFATVFSDVAPLKAIGYGLVPGVLTHISSLLDETPKEIGINVPMQYVNTAINAFVIKSLLGGADNAANILKYFLAYTGLATGQCRVAPDAALKAWGFQKGTANQTFATKLIGQSGLAMTAVAYALGVQGASASTAVGYAAVVYFASLAEFLLSGEFEAVGCDITKCYPWLVVSLATASTLLM